VTVDTEAYVTVPRLNISTRYIDKISEPTLHAADGMWASPPHLGRYPDTDPEVASTENVGIHLQYHK
jgi:hypothetical protein